MMPIERTPPVSTVLPDVNTQELFNDLEPEYQDHAEETGQLICAGKDAFTSRGQALAIIEKKRRTKHKLPPLKVYKCAHCKKFHLSSRVDRKKPPGKKL